MIYISEDGKRRLKNLGLTELEIETCEMILIHDSNSAMARALFISETGVKSRMSEIYKKLGPRGTPLNKHSLLLYLFREIASRGRGYPVALPIGDRN